MNVWGDLLKISTQHKHNSSDMQEYVGKPSETDLIKSQISPKTSRGKKERLSLNSYRK